jgi:geranylgeranyl reductase family protein
VPPGPPGPRAYDAVVTPPDEQPAPGAPEHAAPAAPDAADDATDDAAARARQGEGRPVDPTRKAPAKKASSGAKKASSGAKKASPRRKSAPSARSGDTAGEPATPPAAERPRRRASEPVHDVVVIGAGPAGASCGYWLADAGWDVVVVEKKEFPREKTCGDGLTPRAVRQLADMGLEDALRGSHRYTGLRALGFGQSIEMGWPEHPNFPDYGYTITRHDLDGLVAARAAEAGATLWQGTEVTALIEDETAAPTALPTLAGVTVKAKSSARTRTVKARYVVVADGSNSRVGRMLGTSRQRQLPLGMALRGYYRSDRHDDPFIESHLDIRDAEGNVVPGYGWIFPMGDGRVNVGVGLLSTEQRWKGLNTTHLMDTFVGYAPESWGLSPETSLGVPTGGKLPMGLSVGPRAGGNVVVAGDAAGVINPFNGEGISYGYETGRLAAAALGLALTGGGEESLLDYDRSLTAAYGPYYKVARAFVHLISHPEAMRACVGLGMRSDLLMNQLLRIMANLMRPDAAGPAEIGYRALELVSRLLPDRDGIENPAA